MKADDVDKVADLLGLVYLPDMGFPPTAMRASEACAELSRLQSELRQMASELRRTVSQPDDASHE